MDLESKQSQPISRAPPGSVYLITSDGRVLALPIPSRSRRDPLTWSFKKRAAAFFALIWFAITGLVVVQAPSLMFTHFAQDFSPEDTKPFMLDTLGSAPTLFMGIGALIWIPLSLAIGRRPVVLICSIIMTLANIGVWRGGSFHSILAAVCILGLAEGMSTSAMLLMVIDLTFIHQRPQAIAMLWSIAGALGLVIMSLMPFMVDAVHTWRAFYEIWTVPTALSVVFTFFFFPETYFVRPPMAFDGNVLLQNGPELVLYPDWTVVEGGKTLPDLPVQTTLWARIKDLKLFPAQAGGWRAMKTCYAQVVLCVLNPLIFWVALLNTIVFGGMLSIGQTYSFILEAEPYKLSPHCIALVNLSAAVGSLLAWPVGTFLISRVVHSLTCRNRGVRDPEHYLPAFVLPILTGGTSLILYGLTTAHHWHWFLVCFAYALNSFSFAGMATANTLWVTEAFPQWAAPALVVVGGLSYVASFGMSYAIMPWVQSQGIGATNFEIGGLIFVIGCVIVPIAFWGKRLRQYIDNNWGVKARYTRMK